MLGDLIKKSRPSEPAKVWVVRRFVIIVSLTLLGIISMILCKEVLDELPSIKTIVTTADSLPMPDVGFFFDKNITNISCEIFDKQFQLIQNETECTKKNISPLKNFGDTYALFFSPQGDISFSGEGVPGASEILLHIYNPDPVSNPHLSMRAFDSEFSGFRIDSMNHNSDPFIQEIFHKNEFTLSQVNDTFSRYYWVFSRHKRKIMGKDYSSYIGFQPKYVDRIYLESTLQFVPYPTIPNDNSSIIKMFIYPQSLTLREETEQKSKTVAGIIGALGGFWTIIMAFYIFLFGTELISPWGLLQKSLKLRPFGKESQIEIEEDGKNDLEKRVKDLEKLVQFYGEYVITIPSITEKPWYRTCF